MNGDKFKEIRQKISSMKFVEIKSREPATEFPAPVSNIEEDIQGNIQEIEQERRTIDRDIFALKTPVNAPLETVSFPDPLPKEGEKILAQQSETLRQIVAEQVLLEKNLAARKSSFANKKNELHQKFLIHKGR